MGWVWRSVCVVQRKSDRAPTARHLPSVSPHPGRRRAPSAVDRGNFDAYPAASARVAQRPAMGGTRHASSTACSRPD